MAIQVRRGNYADLDVSKLVQGEPFITLDQVDGNYYVGMAIGASNVVRLATRDDLVDIKQDCEDARDDAIAAKDDAENAATDAETSNLNAEAWAVGTKNSTPVPATDITYHNNSKYYAQNAETAWEHVNDAVQMITPIVSIDFTTGHLSITGSWIDWEIDANGHLTWGVA